MISVVKTHQNKYFLFPFKNVPNKSKKKNNKMLKVLSCFFRRFLLCKNLLCAVFHSIFLKILLNPIKHSFQVEGT